MPLTAVKVPVPEAGESVQVTPIWPGSFCNVAVSVCALPAGTVAKLGSMDTDTAFAGTVSVAEAEIEVLDTDVAVTVTVRSLGNGPAGAV